MAIKTKRGKGKARKPAAAKKGSATKRKKPSAKPARKSARRVAVPKRKPARAVKGKKAAGGKATVQKAKPAARAPTGTPNLLVTYDPNHRGLAEAEVREAFGKAGHKAELLASHVEGLFEMKTANPREAVRQLRKLCSREPGLFKSTYHYTPIDTWCRSEVGEMQKVIKALGDRIGTDEKWRMALNKRHWDKLEGTPLIIKLTEVIDKKKVDLENPQKILQVEIIGEKAGLALITPEEYLNVLKMRTP